MLSTPITILLIVAASFLGMLLGGLGGGRAARRRLNELESDIHSLNERLTREQKKRAGVTLQDQRRDNMAEAAAIAAQAKATTPKPFKLAGRANGATLVE